jgi:hypothetical protein
MQPPTPPNAVALEVVAAQPTDADNAAIEHLTATTGRSLAAVTYLVKVRLDPMPPVTSLGWALYVDDFRVPKYWQYREGIYFKVYDPQFFSDHQGEALRFTHNHTDFVDTGLVLPQPDGGPPASPADAADLPPQTDVLG